MFNNKTFYPTPESLIRRMVSKVKKGPQKILEPSAGKGDIIRYIDEELGYRRNIDISAIEIDEELQATLRGNGVKVIDTDFLSYSGHDKKEV